MIKTNIISSHGLNSCFILWHRLHTYNTCFNELYLTSGKKCHGMYLWDDFYRSSPTWDYLYNLSNPKKYQLINISTEILFMDIM